MLDINSLIQNAMKSKNKSELEAYKNLKSELQKVLTAKNAPEYSEALFIQVTAKYAKSLEDAILQFSEAGRQDLVASYTSELEIVKKLLPEPVNESQIYQEISSWGSLNGYLPPNSVVIHKIDVLPFKIPKKEMGAVIKFVKSQLPTADGKMISEIVKKYLV